MHWQEITFELDAAQAESYEDALMEGGALSVTLRDASNQPLLEPAPETTPLWDKLLLTAMFDEDADIDAVLTRLKDRLSLGRLPAYQVEILEDQEWRRSWMDYFEPIRFGERLWICLSGYAKPDQPDAVVIDLDPGLAFGTGSHATTALCMQWLDGHSLADKTVVDYGCGSGILAVSAAKLGAANVIAIDNDPQALQVTGDNVQANQVENIVKVYAPEAMPALKADILIANILLEPLLSLRGIFMDILQYQGCLVMSGILQAQTSQLQDAYAPAFDFETCEQREEWVRLQAVFR